MLKETLMMKRISIFFFAIGLIFIVLSGCVLPGTGTIRIRNEMTGGRAITNLYIYEAGTTSDYSVISSSIYPNETFTDYGVSPGYYIIEAEIDFGAEWAFEAEEVEEGVFYVVWITDSDIL